MGVWVGVGGWVGGGGATPCGGGGGQLSQFCLKEVIRLSFACAAAAAAAIRGMQAQHHDQLLPACHTTRRVWNVQLCGYVRVCVSMCACRYVDVRLSGCHIAEQLLQVVGPYLSHDHRRSMYVELLKRLDDSSNAVRLGAAAALRVWCDTLPAEYCETNAGYLAAGVAIHMDDADVGVQVGMRVLV